MSFKIAIDSGPLTSGHAFRGIGVMVKEQIEALLKESKNRDLKIEPFDFNSPEGINKLEKGKFDLIHYTSFFPYALTLPGVKYADKVVVTIQDLIHLVYPDKYPPGLRGGINFVKQKSRLHNVDAVITISETSKKDIVRFLDIKSDKISVIYLGPSGIYKPVKERKMLEKIRDKYKLPKVFVFNLGDVNYNKNILTLIEACEQIKVPLVIGGKQAKEIDDLGLLSLMSLSGPKDWVRFLFNRPHPENTHYEKLLEKFKKNKDIYRLGYIPDEDVAAVFSLASVYCQPSFYEGFGLSVIHAFACDVPVVVSRTNCLVEVAGGAALIADPKSSSDFAKQIEKILYNDEVRDNLIKSGRERLKTFNRQETAKGIIKVYEKLLKS